MTNSSSSGRLWLLSALATAESSSLSTSPAGPRVENRSRSRASSISRPRIRPRTSRTLVGEVRRWRSDARVPGTRRPPCRTLGAGVDAERARRRELAELVPDHRLGDVHGHVLAAVVDRDRVAHHVRSDGGATRPRLDDLPVAGRVHRLDLDAQVVVDERALLQAARHVLPPAGAAASSPASDDELVGRLVLAAGAALGLAPRRHRVTSAGALALSAAERVVDRVHGDAAGVRPLALPSIAAGLADLNQRRLDVADLTHRGATVDRHPAHLGRREAQRGEVAFLGHELHGRARAAGELAARARLELD